MMQPVDPRNPEQIEAEAQMIEAFVERLAELNDEEAAREFTERFYVKRTRQLYYATQRRRAMHALELELWEEIADMDDAIRAHYAERDAAAADLEPEDRPTTGGRQYDE